METGVCQAHSGMVQWQKDCARTLEKIANDLSLFLPRSDYIGSRAQRDAQIADMEKRWDARAEAMEKRMDAQGKALTELADSQREERHQHQLDAARRETSTKLLVAVVTALGVLAQFAITHLLK